MQSGHNVTLGGRDRGPPACSACFLSPVTSPWQHPDRAVARARSVLITGATSGFGEAAATRLAASGAHVIVHGRTRRRAEAAAGRIRARSHEARVDVVAADLSDRLAIDALAAEVRTRFPALDVLVHNAAVVPRRREATREGLELQFAVNHLAPMLLTARLLSTLRARPGARIVVVASQVERDGHIDFADLQSQRRYDPYAAYRQSKLANVLFTRALARRIPGCCPTVNCLHPGIAGTRVLNALVGRPDWMQRWTAYREPTADTQAEPLVRLVLDPALDAVSGAYFRELEQRPPSDRSMDDVTGERLWAVSNSLLGLPSDWADSA